MRQKTQRLGWMMLTMVEGISAFGGRPHRGTTAQPRTKHFRLEAVFAIQIAHPSDRIVSGTTRWALAKKKFLFPYADLQLEKRGSGFKHL